MASGAEKFRNDERACADQVRATYDYNSVGYEDYAPALNLWEQLGHECPGTGQNVAQNAPNFAKVANCGTRVGPNCGSKVGPRALWATIGHTAPVRQGKGVIGRAGLGRIMPRLLSKQRVL